ncbi:MAG: transporter substrate-binding domain-containing protein [Methylococcaceae bacterium]|nr:transporter substrate-binding domain-containing protein [Methylococcaceae bacterium]
MANNSSLRGVTLQFLALFVLLASQVTCLAGVMLTPEERAWLQAHSDIRVAISPDYPPISYLDAHGEPTGLEQDYLRLLEDRLGFHFKRIIPTLAQRAANSPEEKQVDVVAIFAATEARLQQWYFTKPYLDFPVYLVTQDNAPIAFSLDNPQQQRISAVGHYAAFGYLKEQYPMVNIDVVDDTCIGLQHVSFGASAGMLTDLPVANWCADHFGLKNLKIAHSTAFHYQMGLAIRKDWPLLMAILEKGLATISPAEREVIYARWNKNSFEKSVTDTYQNWIFAAIFSLLSFLIYSLIQWDKTLKRVLDNRISQQSISGSPAMSASAVTKTVMHSNIVTFFVIMVFIVGTLAFSYEKYAKNNLLFFAVIAVFLVGIALISGFLLGSMRRRYEADHYLNQLYKQTSARQEVEKKLSLSEQRLLKQHDALKLLTQHQLKEWLNPEEVFREIAEIAAVTLNVERVSVWLFSQDQQQIDCMCLYMKSKKLHTIAKPLSAIDLPNYFHHLKQNRVIAANDVMQHAATSEFTASYLPMNNIGAMLDSSIWLNHQLIGVICHEHVGGVREWTLDEQSFAGAIADIARLTIETHRRRQAEQTLMKYSEELEHMVQARTLSLQESERRFGYVVDQAPISILIINVSGEIIEFNPEAEIATGYVRETVIGKSFIGLFVAKEARQAALEMAARLRKGEDVRDVELLLQHANGNKIEFLLSASVPSNTSALGAGQMVAIGQDISQQKMLQKSLIQAREAAESADRIKSMFVASMSHELRTPLNSIIGFLGVVLQGMSGEVNAQQKDQLGRAFSSAKHLLALISDVIDISKIEAGYLNVYVESFEFKPLLLEIVQAVQHLAKSKPLAIKVDCAGDLILETDRKRLYQVVLNVLSNAVKYTEQGSVNIRVSREQGQLIIATQDTGIGIDQESLAKLFEPFERAESHLKTTTLGTGLGLYLTRKILTQLLDGSINVKSKPGEGSLFSISIPVKLATQHAVITPSIL